jgi:hypothetical protein
LRSPKAYHLNAGFGQAAVQSTALMARWKLAAGVNAIEAHLVEQALGASTAKRKQWPTTPTPKTIDHLSFGNHNLEANKPCHGWNLGLNR